MGEAPLRLRLYQAQIVRAVLGSALHGKGHSFSVMVSRQGGKNEVSAQIELGVLMGHLTQGIDSIKCAPTFVPQGLVSLRRLWSRLEALGRNPLARIKGGNVIRLGSNRQF